MTRVQLNLCLLWVLLLAFNDAQAQEQTPLQLMKQAMEYGEDYLDETTIKYGDSLEVTIFLNTYHIGKKDEELYAIGDSSSSTMWINIKFGSPKYDTIYREQWVNDEPYYILDKKYEWDAEINAKYTTLTWVESANSGLIKRTKKKATIDEFGSDYYATPAQWLLENQDLIFGNAKKGIPANIDGVLTELYHECPLTEITEKFKQ